MRRFGEDVMHTMVVWIDRLLQQQRLDQASVSILDVGTGNALLLVQLARLGYKRLTGSDYSPQSINLSSLILQKHRLASVKLEVGS